MIEPKVADQIFIRKLTEIILENLLNEKFGIKELLHESGMSYYSLSRRLHSINKRTVNQFIREVRLEKALEMLKNGRLTASEVAYNVGFSSPVYFTKCFHEFFGYTPSQVLKDGFDSTEEIKLVMPPAKKSQKKISRKTLILTSSGILVLAVLADLAFYVFFKSSSANVSLTEEYQVKSIAILPFINESPDKENEYFCNGMMLEIMNQLEKISDLNVKARSDVEKYRNTITGVHEIGKQLGVSYIMEGSVRKIGEDLRISTQLIDTKSSYPLWSETYEAKYTNKIFDFQSSVAKKIATSMNAVITPKEEKRINAKPTKDLLAHSLSLKGFDMWSRFWNTGDRTYLKIALNLYNESLKIDPNYLEAWTGKGRIYNITGKYDSAMVCANEILKIDPENPNAFELIGRVYQSNHKIDSAIKYYQKEVDICPNREYANLYLGQTLIFDRNDVIRGLPFLQRSYDLGKSTTREPTFSIGYAYLYIGEYPKALKYIKEALSLEPSWCGMVQDYYNILFVQGNYNRALNFVDSVQNYTPCESSCDLMRFYYYTTNRDFKKAEIYYKKFLDTGSKQRIWKLDYYSVIFNYFLKETGRKNEALKGLNSAVKYFETDIRKVYGVDLTRDRLQLAASYAMLGENKKALDYLSQLEKFGLLEYPITLSFPGFDNLRYDPEFKAIIKRIEDQRAANRAKVRKMEESGELHL